MQDAPTAIVAAPPRRSWWVSPVVFLAGMTAGMIMGALTNAITGSISPYYFRVIMGWRGDVYARSILQGVLEGGILGAVFGVVVGLSMALSTGLRGSLWLAIGGLWRAVAAAVVCWALGGAIAMGLARRLPTWYAKTFIEFPWWDADQAWRYAWAGGSIWGAYAGMALGAIWASVWIHRRWSRSRHAAAFAVIAPSVRD